MPKIDAEVKQVLDKLSNDDLKKCILKIIQKENHWYDYFRLTYVDGALGEIDLYNTAKRDIESIQCRNFRGRSEELSMAKMLAACNQRIIDFDKLCKRKELVLDLIMLVLEEPFAQEPEMFWTCFTTFNHKVYTLLRKAITIYETKIHEDLRLNYRDTINEYLLFMHTHSNHLDYVYGMTKRVE